MNTSIIQEIGRPDRMNMSDQVCTDQERNDFWELAGGLPVNARSRGRLGLSLGLLYIRKATALAGVARGVAEPGPETRVARLCPKALRATLAHTLS